MSNSLKYSHYNIRQWAKPVENDINRVDYIHKCETFILKLCRPNHLLNRTVCTLGEMDVGLVMNHLRDSITTSEIPCTGFNIKRGTGNLELRKFSDPTYYVVDSRELFPA